MTFCQSSNIRQIQRLTDLRDIYIKNVTIYRIIRLLLSNPFTTGNTLLCGLRFEPADHCPRGTKEARLQDFLIQNYWKILKTCYLHRQAKNAIKIPRL